MTEGTCPSNCRVRGRNMQKLWYFECSSLIELNLLTVYNIVYHHHLTVFAQLTFDVHMNPRSTMKSSLSCYRSETLTMEV